MTPPKGFPNVNGGGNRRIAQPKTGIWLASLAQIDAECARQRAAQHEQQAQAEASAKQAAQTLLEKYDRNHNGVIDADEREEALDEPGFIKAHLDEIDANHNGWLDAPELAWFDANQNKILDHKEQAGIGLAEQFLAGKLLAQFDRYGNGWLNQMQYDEMIQATLHERDAATFDLQFARADANHDNHVDLDELKNLMQQHLEVQLKMSVPRRPPVPHYPDGFGPPRPPGVGSSFKAKVEAYWQNSADGSNPSPTPAMPK